MEPSVHDDCVGSIDVQCVHVFSVLSVNASRRYSGFIRNETHRRRQEYLRAEETPAWVDITPISTLCNEAVTVEVSEKEQSARYSAEMLWGPTQDQALSRRDSEPREIFA